MDLNALLQNALDLSKHLRGMMDEANALARTGNREGLSADARAALELDELLTNIEKSPVRRFIDHYHCILLNLNHIILRGFKSYFCLTILTPLGRICQCKQTS